MHHPRKELLGVRRPVRAGDRLVLGRGARSAMVGAFDDNSVSREHCAIVRSGETIVVRDLGSRNGTTVNGRAITESELAIGDVIGLGDALLLLELAPPHLEPANHPTLLGISPAIAELHANIGLVAERDTSVMILGETGTGKELVAQELHRLSRRDGRLVPINCGGTSDTLLASELFGHVRGAFTGAERGRKGLIETARGGTLFLDELVDASPGLQVSLLRLLESGEYRAVGSDREMSADVRIVAAAQPQIEKQVDDAGFRRDLWTRVARWVIRIPPLRERRGDIPLLARHFAAQYNGGDIALSVPCVLTLMAHDWRGNVRELAAIVERMVVAAQGSEELGLTPWLLQELSAAAQHAEERTAVSGAVPWLAQQRPSEPAARRASRLTKAAIETALADALGNVQAAAEALGVGRRTLYRRFESMGIDPTLYRREP